jgi:hypothetical protein
MTKENTRNPKSPRQFCIAMVMTPVYSLNLLNSPTRVVAFGASYDAAVKLNPVKFAPTTDIRAGQGGLSVAPQPVTSGGITAAAWNDRLTNESRQNDWTMQIPVVVVLDPQPPAPHP